MITLMVSYDCGYLYCPDRTAATIDELRPRMAELDTKGLRYYLERDGQILDEMCAIHKGIFERKQALVEAGRRMM